MNSQLRQVYAAFNPAPLKEGQQDLYCDLDSVRGSVGVLKDDQ